MVGHTISHYRILEKLGEGGMGAVYKAEDTKLERAVALKFLPAHLLGNEDVRKRFAREAKAAASLDHPNICTVHEIDEYEGKAFISMSLIEGESLDQKISAGPLKLEEALSIAQQVTKGLEAAHKRGIVHRDIKPENIMVGEDGHVTVMDFGLAQLTEASRLTRTDETVGTVAYMSPEQTEGSGTDQRTDIWSLGVVLYEMITGQKPFKGDYDKAVMYSILNEEPEPLTALRTGVPMELELLVSKCLAKGAEERYQHTGELVLDLRALRKKLGSGRSTLLKGPVRRQTAAAEPTSAVDSSELPATAASDPAASREVAPMRKYRLAWVAAAAGAALAVLSLAYSFLRLREAEPPAVPLRHFSIAPAAPVRAVSAAGESALAISPDGNRIAFTEEGPDGRIWILDLERNRSRALGGTEGARAPFWSPDGNYIAYAVGDDLAKVSLEDGQSVTVCSLPAASEYFFGGAWSADGEVMVFADGGLWQVSALGGEPSPISLPEEISEAVHWPHFLPLEAGRRVVAFAHGGLNGALHVFDVETGRFESLGPGDRAFYSPSGHLVYQPSYSKHDLWAMPFSLDTLSAAGEAFPIAENARIPSVARDGTLVYLDGAAEGAPQLVWLDRRGNKTGEIGQPQESLGFPALSPDGRRVAVEAEGDVWVYEIERGVRTRLSTSPEYDFRPVWSPTGNEVAFTSSRAGSEDIFIRQADGSGEERLLLSTLRHASVSDWSRDGNYLLCHSRGSGDAGDLWYLLRREDGSGWDPHLLLQTSFGEVAPRLSPDGRYVAYQSNESGQSEVYVQPFPDGGRRVTVSSNGGTKVRWSRDGDELFYVEGQTLVAVPVTSGASFSVGSATRLFDHPSLSRGGYFAPYDVSVGGRRFILPEVQKASVDAGEPSIHVVQNWYEEFRDRQQD